MLFSLFIPTDTSAFVCLCEGPSHYHLTFSPPPGFSDARRKLLDAGIAKISDSISGQTVVDPKGYLTDIDSLKMSSDAEIGDIKKVCCLCF